MCINTMGTLYSLATSFIFGSNRRAEMSLIICAPASSARLATSALYVSMEIGTSVFLDRD